MRLGGYTINIYKKLSGTFVVSANNFNSYEISKTVCDLPINILQLIEEDNACCYVSWFHRDLY